MSEAIIARRGAKENAINIGYLKVTETIIKHTRWTPTYRRSYNINGKYFVVNYAYNEAVHVRIFGGGGGGTGIAGGGGGWMNNAVLNLFNVGTVNIVIGSGGPGGVANQNGFAGGTTFFGTYLSANGGEGATYHPAYNIRNGGGWCDGSWGGNGGAGGCGMHGGRGYQFGGGSAICGNGGDGGTWGGGGLGAFHRDIWSSQTRPSSITVRGGNGGTYGGGGSVSLMYGGTSSLGVITNANNITFYVICGNGGTYGGGAGFSFAGDQWNLNIRIGGITPGKSGAYAAQPVGPFSSSTGENIVTTLPKPANPSSFNASGLVSEWDKYNNLTLSYKGNNWNNSTVNIKVPNNQVSKNAVLWLPGTGFNSRYPTDNYMSGGSGIGCNSYSSSGGGFGGIAHFGAGGGGYFYAAWLEDINTGSLSTGGSGGGGCGYYTNSRWGGGSYGDGGNYYPVPNNNLSNYYVNSDYTADGKFGGGGGPAIVHYNNGQIWYGNNNTRGGSGGDGICIIQYYVRVSNPPTNN